MQSDPIGLAGGLNTYGYVGGNAITRIDLLGLCDCSRSPDFIVSQIDIYIASISVTYSHYGDMYVGIGTSRPYPTIISKSGKPSIGASISMGWLMQCNMPTRDELNNFVDGYAGGGGIYLGAGASVASNPAGDALMIGIGMGGLGINPGIVNNYMGNVFGE